MAGGIPKHQGTGGERPAQQTIGVTVTVTGIAGFALGAHAIVRPGLGIVLRHRADRRIRTATTDRAMVGVGQGCEPQRKEMHQGQKTPGTPKQGRCASAMGAAHHDRIDR